MKKMTGGGQVPMIAQRVPTGETLKLPLHVGPEKPRLASAPGRVARHGDARSHHRSARGV
jgi:hypothetical protein